jgi:hypothetical protein
MATETIRPGWAFKEDNTTADYEDNYVALKGAITTLKIKNDGGNPLQFMINRSSDSEVVDGIVLANEELTLNDIDQGLNSVAVKGAVASAYRLWAYY